MAGFYTKTFSKYDDFMTPSYVWDWIVDYIPKDKIIWECFYGDGNSGKYLSSLGFNVIHEDIDFFKHNHGDICISNPPFSIKPRVFLRLKELQKPFIMLCPISTITTKYFYNLFANDIQIILPPKRIQFIKLVDGKDYEQLDRCNFDCCFICWKMNLPRDIIFIPR